MPVTTTHTYNNGNIVRTSPSSSSSSNNNIDKQKKNKKTYRSHHTNYTPFLKYIRDHESVDDETVQRAESKFGRISSNTQMSSSSSSSSVSTTSSFSQQLGAAAVLTTKEERDDARHEDLHANYKQKEFTDNDRIFLMKREIESLRGTLQAQRKSDQRSASAWGDFASGGPARVVVLPSVLLFFGVVLVAARSLSRRLRRIRAADSLLSSEDEQQSRSYEYAPAGRGGGGDDAGDDAVGVELSERSYEAPSSASIEHEIRFV
mmetsp:Transcript_19523/g.45471  ORF Transcript_19523/g.45471 Transcript_19523/m.45471 type:complete len:262 (+) Transcript_19523:221-1006(+)